MSIAEPDKITNPWASSGLKNPIPPAANPTTGRAGFDLGFPPITMSPIEVGGLPPQGQDFNGIFYDITNILRYMQAGGQPTFSSALATAIGGYPKGAMVLGSDGVTLWQSKAESNSTDPNIDPTGWSKVDVGLRADLASNSGSSLVGGIIKPVTAFYLPSDGGDYSKAVTRGFLTEKALYFPHRPDNTPWACNTTFTIPSNCALILDRCDLKTDVYINLIEQDGKSEWSLTANGVCRIIGPRVGTVGEPSSIGLNMVDCYRPTFGANGVLIFQDWSDRGWKASSTTFTGKASFGSVTNVYTRNNSVGWDLGDGDGCEYWTLTNIRSFSNYHGAYFKSPNTMVVGGGCTHNVTNGLHAMTGFNDGHSSFIGFSFNHNGVNNLNLLGINNGLSFVGCQSFDDGEGSGTGKFKIESCKGINWSGGELNVDFEVTGACAANTINNAYFVSDTRAYNITGDNAAKKQLFFNRCTNPVGCGAFSKNTFTQSYTLGYGGTSSVPTAVATNIPVTEQVASTIGLTIYDSGTGRWVARNAGKYVMDVYLDLGSSNGTMPAGVYILIKVNGIGYQYIPCFTLSASDAFGKAVVEFENLSIGDYVEAQVFVPSGTVNFRARTRISMNLLI